MHTSKLFFLRRTLTVAACAALASVPAGAITVTANSNAMDLIHVITGGSTITIGNATFTGAPNSAGTFTGGLASGIGISSGIVLTSGNATLIGNSNTSDNITGDNGLPGDALLDTLAGYDTHDATVLAFDFTTTSGNLYFNFVFGSDEYNEWSNSPYNDIFAFTIDGVNVALLPGISPATPIAIDTVNGGNPLGTNAQHPQFYRNNERPALGGPSPFAFEYDGFTTVFTISKTGLSAGTHTMRLAIADGSDWVLDSGVFIQAGSFDENEHEHDSVPDATQSAGLAAVGFGLILLARRRFGLAQR